MVLYVAFVAVTNVCIGFAIGRMLHWPKRRHDDDESWDVDVDVHDRGESKGGADDTPSQAAEAVADEHSCDKQRTADSTQPTSRNTHRWLGEKGEFATQLREVTERVNYSRSARDKTLLRQAADQVLSCISTRYEELQGVFTPADGNEPLVGPALDGAEMLSAQIETSISNLRALDWSASVDDVGTRLDCELTLLNEQQRALSSVLRNAKS